MSQARPSRTTPIVPATLAPHDVENPIRRDGKGSLTNWAYQEFVSGAF
ncbi:hypothetical protein [Paractinoplanes brasiliensis]|uniref:Uncharacterized protein n=1 Tax=Paractinoplanes brasiliensis TaxID=52695 RepID=A0A4R6JB74_9ACTN|nr:hypothetical protein [Actinoplanes brasiliensis]TDO32939.1 hypothetical protein C8E87_8417 [Actinoplanes brasiliensis]